MCALSLRQGVTKITCLRELDEREVTASLTSRQSHKETSRKHTKTARKQNVARPKGRKRLRGWLQLAGEKPLSWYSQSLNLIWLLLWSLLSCSGFQKDKRSSINFRHKLKAHKQVAFRWRQWAMTVLVCRPPLLKHLSSRVAAFHSLLLFNNGDKCISLRETERGKRGYFCGLTMSKHLILDKSLDGGV